VAGRGFVVAAPDDDRWSPKAKGGLEARRFETPFRFGSPGGAGAPPGLEGYFLAFFAFFAFFTFFAFFAFLAIVNPLRVQWMETRHEACSAEGHPCNILDRNPNRFAARCPALSRQCHRVIHSCYALLTLFRRTTRAAAQKSAPRASDRGVRIRFRVNDERMPAAQSASIRNSGAETAAIFMISKPRHRLLLCGESPLSGTAAF
jgi:hypothetical protein